MAGPDFRESDARSFAPREGERGFSLLEVIIALAVSTIVIGTVSLTMLGATRSVLAVRQDSVTSSFLSQMSSIFRNPVFCAAAFKDASGNPIDVNPAAVLPLPVPRIEFCPSTPCTSATAVLAEQGKRTGGELNGVLVTAMTLDNPSLVAGARYRWTLKISTQKADAKGAPLPGSPQIHYFQITIVTNDGSPDYHVTSCGIESADPLSIAPPPILMTRAATWPVDTTTNPTKDIQCNLIGSDYTTATLMDLVQLQAAPGTTGATQPSRIYFTTYGDNGNAYALDHPPGNGNGIQINHDPAAGQIGQIACVHRTAPIRFTRTTTHQPTDGTSTHNLDCDKAFGPNYVSAAFSDLFHYGYVNVPANALNALSSTDVTLAGTSNTCRLAYHPTIGLAMDCTQPNAAHALGCVTRSN